MKNQREDHVSNWIRLFGQAMRRLTPERFDLWLAGVGSSGTYEERCVVGKAILTMLKRDQYPIELVNLHDGLDEVYHTNAISPDAGGAPCPRGVR